MATMFFGSIVTNFLSTFGSTSLSFPTTGSFFYFSIGPSTIGTSFITGFIGFLTLVILLISFGVCFIFLFLLMSISAGGAG